MSVQQSCYFPIPKGSINHNLINNPYRWINPVPPGFFAGGSPSPLSSVPNQDRIVYGIPEHIKKRSTRPAQTTFQHEEDTWHTPSNSPASPPSPSAPPMPPIKLAQSAEYAKPPPNNPENITNAQHVMAQTEEFIEGSAPYVVHAASFAESAASLAGQGITGVLSFMAKSMGGVDIFDTANNDIGDATDYPQQQHHAHQHPHSPQQVPINMTGDQSGEFGNIFKHPGYVNALMGSKFVNKDTAGLL